MRPKFSVYPQTTAQMDIPAVLRGCLRSTRLRPTRCSRKLQVPSYQVVERPHLTSTCIPPFLPPRSHDLEIAMSVNFTRLWKKARAAPNETEFVRSLAEILSSRDGRKFILTLNQEDAEQCIEIMDQVRSPHLYYS